MHFHLTEIFIGTQLLIHSYLRDSDTQLASQIALRPILEVKVRDGARHICSHHAMLCD